MAMRSDRIRDLLMLAPLLAVLTAGCSRPASGPAPAGSPSPADPGAPPLIDRVTPLQSPLPDIVARVNGNPVHLQQVLGLAKKGLESSKQREQDMPGAVRQALQQYVVRELLLQEAMARGVAADTRKVETIFDQVRAGFKDEGRWRASLAEQGLDPQSYKQELRAQETVNALLAKVGEGVTVSDEEVKAAFEANPRAIDPGEKLKIRGIFFRLPPAGTEQVKEAFRVRAATAANRARAGEDFEKLVQEFSDDQASKDRGGRLEIGRGMMPRPFEQAAYALRPGEVSGLVETPEGLSVIKLDERVPGPPVSFDAVKEAVRIDLLGRKRKEAFQALVNSLRAKARIETYL